MLFGHQNDANQPQPQQAADQPEPGFIGPQDQQAQTVAPQDPAVQDATAAPQDDTAGVNPLAVDPATGASLPVVPQNSPDAMDVPAPEAYEQPSVLNQPSTPSVDVDTPQSSDPFAMPEQSHPSAYSQDTSSSYADSPFSATAADPAPAPVLDQAEEDHEAAAIAQELDAPDEQNSTVLAQEPAAAVPTPEAPAPAAETPADPQQTTGFDAPVADTTTDDTSFAPAPAAPAPPQAAQPQADDSLLALKQQAIAQLSPLVSHLDQGPEEKFRTTMMLLQSTDNPALLHDAYTAAQAITDDGARAQALLDVVNEINYFTQQQDAQNS